VQSEPRPTQTAIAQALDVAPARLAQFGYRIDRAKVERFADAGLVAESDASESGLRTMIARLRQILDVEHMLAPWRDVDALAFYLVAHGVEDVPALPVARFLAASVGELTRIGDSLPQSLLRRAVSAGPDTERRIGGSLARAALAGYKPASRADGAAIEALLGSALVAYVRLRSAPARPATSLHVSSRLVTLDKEEEEEGKPRRGARSKTRDGSLPPLADGERVALWLAAQARDSEVRVIAAARASAAIVRRRTSRFPEVQAVWRETAEACGFAGLGALRAISVVPAVLASAILQATDAIGHVGGDVDPDRLVRYWGTEATPPVRFALHANTFPWVPRGR
jgi:hypothetical protein